MLISDDGTKFINNTIKKLAEEYNMTHSTAPPYHPQANPVERVNRVLKAMIISFLEQDQHRDWDKHVYDFRFAFNSASHSSTGLSPAFLNFGRDPISLNSFKFQIEKDLPFERIPEEIWANRMFRLSRIRDWVAKNLEESHDRQCKYFNPKRRDLAYAVGDKVLIRNRVLSKGAVGFSAKLAHRFAGPFEVIKVLSPLIYVIKNLESGKEVKASAMDLKPFIQRNV